MKWLKHLCWAVLAIVILLIVEGGTLKSIFGVGDIPRINFAVLERTPKPNQFVVCPPGLCPAKVDLDSPTFEVHFERLQTAWHEIASAEPRVELADEDDKRHLRSYVQRTAIMRYPDIITVQFIPEKGGGSALAIYSRSIYGYWDLGVNKRRVNDWLAKLQSKLAT